MSAPLAWVRKIASAIPELNAIPLFGNAPPFDWARFGSEIGARFAIPHLAIHPREQHWREPDEIRKGLGKHLQIYPIVIAPIGTVYWMASQEDLVKLTSWFSKPALTSEILQEGFYRYLCLEALDTLQAMQPLQTLTLHLSEEERPPDGKTFCVDVEIELNRKSCWGRLAIPAEFQANWIRHFESMPTEYVPTELSRHIELDLGVRTGSVQLDQAEWNSLQEGDFLLLDRESYDARKDAGVALLALGPTPLFNVKIHNNRLHILDYAFYYEDNMEQNSKENPTDEEVIAIKELPLFVTVELARLKMSLDQLMHLNPGNTLELPIHPNQSVSLTISGQKVGRAELVYLGETLGLRDP